MPPATSPPGDACKHESESGGRELVVDHVANALTRVLHQALPDETCTRCAGTCEGSDCQDGSDFITSASVSDTFSPENARRPDTISNRTAPNAQTSARLSTAVPWACSGAM